MQHILQSAKDYNHKSFADVKNEVILMLIDFVERAVQSIETGTPVEAPKPAPAFKAEPATPASTPKKPEDNVGPNDKLSFAMDNRHLAGKTVSVANDKSIVITGKVVGLDAPFVLVKTDTGPTIKVPLDKVSLG